MRILIRNVNLTMCCALTLLNCLGFWRPDGLRGWKRALMGCYTFLWYMCVNGNFIIFQAGDLIQVWGDMALVTSTATVMLTSSAMLVKIAAVVVRRRRLQDLVESIDEALRSEMKGAARGIIVRSNKQLTVLFFFYWLVTTSTVTGWATSAGNGTLPVRAWLPYDETKSPAYEITYAYMAFACYMLAYMNISLDLLMTTLIALCRCRLQVVSYYLQNLCLGVYPKDEKYHLSTEHEQEIRSRMSACVKQHQETLEQAQLVQQIFSEPILAQFSVSSVIICVTLYQVAFEANTKRVISFVCYLVGMMMQVFLFCYEGNELTVQSRNVADAAYESLWYTCSERVRSSLLIVMARTRRELTITGGGYTVLSLDTFTRIIKASYSFFTVLQQVHDEAEA